MSGGLYDPLGMGTATRRTRSRLPGGLLALGVCAALLAVLALVVVLRSGGERGEPHAVVTIERPPPLPAPAAAAVASPPATAAAPAASPQGAVGDASSVPGAAVPDADVEIQNGVRIIRMHPDAARLGGGQTGTAPRASTGALPPLPGPSPSH